MITGINTLFKVTVIRRNNRYIDKSTVKGDGSASVSVLLVTIGHSFSTQPAELLEKSLATGSALW
jgi:hypothetical protein